MPAKSKAKSAPRKPRSNKTKASAAPVVVDEQVASEPVVEPVVEPIVEPVVEPVEVATVATEVPQELSIEDQFKDILTRLQ